MDKTKTLLVLRHAKSSWEEPDKQDFDRALKSRGLNDIRVLAREIRSKVNNLDAIFSSPANRAIHTAILFSLTVGFPLEKIRITKNLYETDEHQLEKFVKEFLDDLNTVMIVGHNPTLTDFVNLFLKESIYNIPTSGFIGLIFSSTKWKKIDEGSLISSFFHFPKEFQ
jgi:phosphohistidine phosphatase